MLDNSQVSLILSLQEWFLNTSARRSSLREAHIGEADVVWSRLKLKGAYRSHRGSNWATSSASARGVLPLRSLNTNHIPNPDHTQAVVDEVLAEHHLFTDLAITSQG